MAEKRFEAQVNYGWGLTLNMTGKAPAVSKRIFDTLADAQAFADDYNDSAVEGLTLSVVNDGNNNGVYFVQSIKTTKQGAAAVLVKLGTEAGASSDISTALGNLDLTDSAVKGKFVTSVSQNDGQISVTRANLTDAVVGTTAGGQDITLSDKFTAISEEIQDAQEAAEAAATKMAKASGTTHITLSESTDQSTGAITYTIGESDVASATLLGTTSDTYSSNTAFGKIAAEKRRAEAAEAEIESDLNSYKTTNDAAVQSLQNNKANSSDVKFAAGTGTNSAILKGTNVTANNQGEVAIGKFNSSTTGSTESAKTLFTVGNGTSTTDRSNAFEVRENGDLWINLGNDYTKLQTVLSNEIDWYEGD